MTVRLERGKGAWGVPFAVIGEPGLLTLGFTFLWLVFEWERAADRRDEGLVELARVGAELADRLKPSPN